MRTPSGKVAVDSPGSLSAMQEDEDDDRRRKSHLDSASADAARPFTFLATTEGPVPLQAGKDTSALSFSFPLDPSDMTGLPLNANENPFFRTTHEGDAPPVSTRKKFSPTSRITIAYEDLTRNLHPDVLEKIEANPAHYLAVVPFGAGKKYADENPQAVARLREFIVDLKVDAEVNVARGAAQHKPKGDFDPPWVYILVNASEKLRAFLLWQQTFAVPSLAFNVVPFDKSVRSWIIMNLSGDPVSNDIKAMHRALGAIKETLWKNDEFRRIANQCLAAIDVGSSASERAFLVTKTYELRYFDYSKQGDSSDNPLLQWALMGKPITEDPVLHLQYLRIIRNVTYFVGLHKLDVRKVWLDCVWCKSDWHPACRCPFPASDDWIGPKLARTDDQDLLHKKPKPKLEKGERTQRGRRGRGPQMRGRGK
jgi:hypothetical protein